MLATPTREWEGGLTCLPCPPWGHQIPWGQSSGSTLGVEEPSISWVYSWRVAASLCKPETHGQLPGLPSQVGIVGIENIPTLL
jgi:hypothetical protein